MCIGTVLLLFIPILASLLGQGLVARHAKDALGSSGISKVLDFVFAVSTSEAACTESLISGQNGQIFNLVAASAAAICTVVAY
jgi:hypothetical protein